MEKGRRITFTKMHGCGNDYIYVDAKRYPLPMEEKPKLVRRLSDRHFGIGSDGVIFIHTVSKDGVDFEMEMWNADGTRAEMCGNGIRCVGKYVYDKGLTAKEHIAISSAGKVKYLECTVKDGKVEKVRVNMGHPAWEASKVPVLAQKAAIDEPVLVKGQEYRMTCISMGNPHAVVYMDEIDSLDIQSIGPYFECHERFPNKTNTEFVKVLDRHTIRMRVWERGTGETLACGTGACAAAVASVLNGLTEEEVTVKLLGGELSVLWDRTENTVYMTGPAETVFEGTFIL